MKTTCLEISDIIETHKMQVVCDQGDHRLIMMLLMRPNTDAPGSQHNVSSWCSWSPPWVVIIRIDLDNFGFSLFSCKFYSEFDHNSEQERRIFDQFQIFDAYIPWKQESRFISPL